jgi:hypothetical protein
VNGSQKYKSTLDEPTMRLLVFLHGTVIMHASATGRTREERVAQVRIAADPTLRDYAEYVPVDNAVAKLWRWREQGVRIDYLSSHQKAHDVAKDDWVLQKYGFPSGRVLARADGESYGQIAAREMPDVLIEDNCESIGPDQITYLRIRPELRSRIKSIIVPEFGGIDHLPNASHLLLTFES